MFRHLCSACEEAMRILLTANSRSVPVCVFYQVSFPRSIHRRNGILLKRESEVSMIGPKYLWSDTWCCWRNTDSSESTLHYTFTSTVYLAISRTVFSACPSTELASERSRVTPPTFWCERIFANKPDKIWHFFFTTCLKNTSGLLKSSYVVFR